MAIGEDALKLPAYKECVDDTADRRLVLHLVDHDGEVDAGAVHGSDPMSVAPEGKRAIDLNIYEMTVELKLGDLCQPVHAKGKQRKRPEAESDS